MLESGILRILDWNRVVTEPVTARNSSSTAEQEDALPKILCLGGKHDLLVNVQQGFGDNVEIVEVCSPVRALAHLARGDYAGVYADAEHFIRSF